MSRHKSKDYIKMSCCDWNTNNFIMSRATDTTITWCREIFLKFSILGASDVTSQAPEMISFRKSTWHHFGPDPKNIKFSVHAEKTCFALKIRRRSSNRLSALSRRAIGCRGFNLSISLLNLANRGTLKINPRYRTAEKGEHTMKLFKCHVVMD